MQQLLNGLFIGAIYALFAIGFTLVFGVLDRLNLAHPAVFAVSAFVGIELVEVAGLSIWLTLPIVFVVGGILGIVIERVAFRPLKERPDAHFAGLISSIALADVNGTAGVVLYTAALTLLSATFADILQAALDPRIR